jgi:hypothetical protein
MSYYSVSATGIWPNERYLYQIDTNVIDPRFGLLPIKVFTSPQYSEDHNFAVKSYNPPNFNNSVIGLSSNKPYIYTENNGELNATIEQDLSFYWTPSSLRTKNYGNMLNGILLNTSDNKHFTVISYPTELFLYPVTASVINNYQTLTSEVLYLSAYTQQNLDEFFSDVTSITAGLTALEIEDPLVYSFTYTTSTLNEFRTVEWESWYETTSSGEVNSFVEFTSSVDTSLEPPLSYLSFLTLENTVCSYYVGFDAYNVDYNFAITSVGYASSVTFTNKITSIDYITLYQEISSRNYSLQTQTVLLSAYDFQLYSIEYGRLIKVGHNQYLSTVPLTGALSDNNLKSLSYTLSGAIVNSNRELIKFTENNNPIFENIILEREGISVRPDTVKIAYIIQFLDSDSVLPNKIELIGDEYDDMVLNADRSIETSYIVGYDDNENKLTFQLLQSGIDLSLPMEHPANCVLSATLDLDNSHFEYINQRFTTFDALFASYTPISGVPNTSLILRYIANTPYDETDSLIESNVLDISSNYGNFSVNSSVLLNQDAHDILWTLKNPPYYYNFKNSYTDNNDQLYKNKNTLSFYLSSELISNQLVKPVSSDPSQDYSKIDLYTSIYSEYDILELPLKEYGFGDLLKYELVFRDETLVMQNVSAYIVFADTKEEAIVSDNLLFYDINSSPYIPAISGSFLRIIYDLDSGGAIFSVKPSIKTKIGVFDAFWGTTFSSAIDYQPRNFIVEPFIDTLELGISSVVVSVADLTGNLNTFLDLRDTFIRWDYSNSSYPLLLVNKTSSNDVGDLTIIEPDSSYLFNIANTVEILGLSEENIEVTVYSESFDISSTITVEPTLFNLYYENRLLIEFEPIDIKNKFKILKTSVKVPFADKKFNVGDNSKIKWSWIYDNIEDTTTFPVSAFYNIEKTQNIKNLKDLLNYGTPYEIDNVVLSEEADSLYFLIDTPETSNEEVYPLSAFVEVYDTGDVYNSVSLYEINSYPESSVFSTDFYVTYPNFPTYQVANTQNNILSLTRPPNGTNIFQIIPYELKTQNISISSLKWNVKTTIIPTSGESVPYVIEEDINLTPNVSGFYEDIILNKNFNLYNTVTKTYYNNEFLTGISSVPILLYSEFEALSSYLTSPDLVSNRTTLNSITAFENITPLATSLNVIVTSYYTTSFNSFEDLNIVKNDPNFYELTYVELISGDDSIIDDDGDSTSYVLYTVDYWLSSQNFIISDSESNIDLFSATNIWDNDNIIFYETLTTPTTTFEYVLTKDFVEQNAYAISDVSLVAENVSIVNWENLYDFKKTIQIIVTNDQEFLIEPQLKVVPKHVWIPEWRLGNSGEFSKKTNKFVTHVPDNPISIYNIISGVTYGNRVSCQEYHLIITDVQEFDINPATDPINIIIGVGNENVEIMDTQIIDSPSEYVLEENAKNTVKVLNFRIPCYPDMYQSSGMTIYISAFNRFFPLEGGFQYYGLNSLTATELTLFNYPLTSKTLSRDLINIDKQYQNPQLIDYDPPRLLFYPRLINLDLDTQRIIQVKQILEIDPIESPVEIELDESGVIYELKSDFWTVSSVVPALSNETYDLFKLSVGDSTIPLTISDYDQTTLVLTATAMVATKIPPTTFNRYTSSEYIEDRDIWGTVYQMAIGNEDQPYKILFSRVNSLSTETQTISTYNILAANDNLILTT